MRGHQNEVITINYCETHLTALTREKKRSESAYATPFLSPPSLIPHTLKVASEDGMGDRCTPSGLKLVFVLFVVTILTRLLYCRDLEHHGYANTCLQAC